MQWQMLARLKMKIAVKKEKKKTENATHSRNAHPWPNSLSIKPLQKNTLIPLEAANETIQMWLKCILI